jgi:SAM-dependent methyltransferase
MTNAGYCLAGYGGDGERLEALARGLEAAMEDLFSRIEVAPKARVLDIGCGPGDTTRQIKSLFPDADVVGVDRNPAFVDHARMRTPPAYSGLSFGVGDASELSFAAGSFDLVFCRFVLMHLADPSRAVAEFARVLRPGGKVIVIEPDWGGQILYPGIADDERWKALAARLGPKLGFDPHMGRKLFGLLKGQGFQGVQIEARSDVSTADHPEVAREKLAHRCKILTHLRETIVATGQVTANELDALCERWSQLADTGEFFATEFRVIAAATVAELA